MTSPHHDELFLAIGRLEGKVDSLLSMQGQLAVDTNTLSYGGGWTHPQFVCCTVVR